jgi:hypothetical protein
VPALCLPHSCFSNAARQSASPKEDSVAPFSSSRILAIGGARPLAVAFSNAAAPHLPPSHVAPRSSSHSVPHGMATRPTLPRRCHPRGSTDHSSVSSPSPAMPHPPRRLRPLSRHVVLRPLPHLGQVDWRGGRHWPGLGQAQAQLAAARPRHHPRLPACHNRPPPPLCIVSHGKRVRNACYKTMFQVFQMFYRYVAHVSCGCCKSRSGCCICCKRLFKMFHLFLRCMFASTFFIWMLYMSHKYC